MSDEILANLEKHMEGNQLALAAVAEVLQKMDARLLKEEEDSEEEEMEKAAEAEKEALVAQLREDLLETTRVKQLERQNAEAQATQELGYKIPYQIYIG